MRAGLAVLLFLVACGSGSPSTSGDVTPDDQNPGPGSQPGPGGGPGSAGNPRPADAPDVLLLSVSGHSFSVSGLLCDDADNRAYLADPGRAVEAVKEVLDSLGLSVEVKDFADRLRAPDDDGDGVPDRGDQLGFEELLAAIDKAFADWIAGFDNPTRIVIVAHSHGTNWSHILAAVRPEIPIEIQITLDGICFFFECEHSDEIAEFIAEHDATPGNAPFLLDFSRPCDAIDVPGFGDPFNMKDVVFPSVTTHLEVQSDDFLIFDSTDNVRTDGTEVGVIRLNSTNNHSDVADAGDEAMNWVQDRIVEVLFGG